VVIAPAGAGSYVRVVIAPAGVGSYVRVVIAPAGAGSYVRVVIASAGAGSYVLFVGARPSGRLSYQYASIRNPAIVINAAISAYGIWVSACCIGVQPDACAVSTVASE